MISCTSCSGSITAWVHCLEGFHWKALPAANNIPADYLTLARSTDVTQYCVDSPLCLQHFRGPRLFVLNWKIHTFYLLVDFLQIITHGVERKQAWKIENTKYYFKYYRNLDVMMSFLFFVSLVEDFWISPSWSWSPWQGLQSWIVLIIM